MKRRAADETARRIAGTFKHQRDVAVREIAGGPAMGLEVGSLIKTTLQKAAEMLRRARIHLCRG